MGLLLALANNAHSLERLSRRFLTKERTAVSQMLGLQGRATTPSEPLGTQGRAEHSPLIKGLAVQQSDTNKETDSYALRLVLGTSSHRALTEKHRRPREEQLTRNRS